MPLLQSISAGFRGLFRKQQMELDLDEEIRSHLDLLADQRIREGMSSGEARRAARIELGGIEQVKEQVRAVRAGVWLETLWQDLRFAVRMLRKSPGFTIVAVLTLALGIGATTAIFTVVEGVLLRPLPYPDAERIVRIGSAFRDALDNGAVIAGPHYQFLREYSKSFEFVEAHDVITAGVNVSGATEPEHLVSAAVSAGFFDVLGVAPALGRAFTTEEDRPGGPCVVVLTDSLWHRRYTGDSGIVGRTVELNSESCLVTGVLPPSFRFDQNADIFMPTRIPAATRDLGHSYFMLARLKPGVTLAQAQAELQTLLARFKTSHGDLVSQDETGIAVRPYLDWIVGDARPSLWILFGAVGLLLFIACINVANLLLSRSAARTREIATRAALGAGRLRLTRQLLTEGALLAFVGGSLGLLMACWGVSVLRAIAPSTLPRVADISLDLRVTLFVLLLSEFTVLVFALAPALRAGRIDVDLSLKDASGRASSGTDHASLRTLLIGAEIALSFILLTGAVLLTRSFVALRGVGPGFDPANILVFKMSPLPRYSTTLLLSRFEQQTLERLDALPGVESASVAICMPLELGPDMPSEIIGQSPPNTLNPHYRTVSPDYFRSLKISMIRGRSFADSDTSDSAPVIIINDSMARGVFKGSDPLGQQIHLGVGLGPEYVDPPRVIVGVAGDVRESRLNQPAGWTVFIPRAQVPTALTAPINRLVGTSWAVRTRIPPEQLADTVRHAVLTVDPEQPISDVRTMEQMMSASVGSQRFTLLLMTIFATLGVLLASVGVYGVISYVVSQRTREISIRTALGAQRGDILKMVISNGLKPALIGVGTGIAGAVALAHLLSTLLFGVRPADPATFIAVTILLLSVALLACYIPAKRATKVDPMVALRHE